MGFYSQITVREDKLCYWCPDLTHTRAGKKDQHYSVSLFQDVKDTQTSNDLSCSFSPYISSTERPKAWEATLQRGSLSVTIEKLGEAIDAKWFGVHSVPSLIPLSLFIAVQSQPQERKKKKIELHNDFFPAASSISVEQRSNYIYISVPVMDTSESPESREIQISQGFLSYCNLLWGGKNNHTWFYLEWRWFINV